MDYGRCSQRVTPVLSAALVVLWTAAPVLGQADRVEAYVKAEMARSHTPAVSVAVVQQGRVTLCQGYGMADLELSSPASKDTLYETLSIT